MTSRSISATSSALPGFLPSSAVRPAEHVAAAPQPAPVAPPVDENALARNVEAVNKALQAADDHLSFSIHKGTNQVVVRLVDGASNQVLREFPSERFLDMVAKLQQLVGVNVDVKL